ncbi:MAG: PHB depolymerase family esterase [Dehalococcoidia bacterium]
MTLRRHSAVTVALIGAVIALLLLSGCRDRARDRGGEDAAATAVTTTPTATGTPAATLTAAPAATPAATAPAATMATAAATATVAARPAEPGTSERQLSHGGLDRSYLLHIPPSYDGRTPTPLVLIFHGGGGNARNVLRQTHFDQVADRNGFIAVFPNGTGRLARLLLTFNAGNCCGVAVERGVDDVGFARALIDELTSTLAVDPRRVYVTGLSNGAMLSYRLACEAADLIAAVAPVAGALNAPNCSPAVPISLIAFHGTADQAVLYEGGSAPVQPDRRDRVDASVADSVGFFVAFNGCGAEPASTRSGSIVRDSWAGCAGGAAVELYTVEGGGHAWPGGEGGFAGSDVPTDEIDAGELMYAFFAAHPKP